MWRLLASVAVLLHPTPLLRPQVAHTPVAPVGSPVGSSLSLIPEDGLPPILISTGVKGGTGGHITGACPHPHHSAASSLLCQLMCLCLSCAFLVFYITAHVTTTHCQQGRYGLYIWMLQCCESFWWSLAVVNLDFEHHFPLLPHLRRHHLSLSTLSHHRFFLSVYLTLSQLHPFLHPPLLLLFHSNPPADYAVEERPSESVLMQQLEEGGPDPLVFVLNANLLAMVKLVNCEFPS